MDQSSCLDVLELANSSVQKLREMSKLFCREGTQPEMLALLKKTCIEPVGSELPVLDRILSMHGGFKFHFKNRFNKDNLERLSEIYDMCSGRDFSATHETDPDFVKKLARVGMHFGLFD